MESKTFQNELSLYAKERFDAVAKESKLNEQTLLANRIIDQMKNDAYKRVREEDYLAKKDGSRIIQGYGYISFRDRNIIPVLSAGNVRLSLNGNHKKYKAKWHFALDDAISKELTALLCELAEKDGFQLSEPFIALHKSNVMISKLIPGWGHYQTRGQRDIKCISEDEYWMHDFQFVKLIESNVYKHTDKAHTLFMGGIYNGIVAYYATIGWKYCIEF